MKILIDTREQRPFPFRGQMYADVQTEIASLRTADYSLPGCELSVGIERKELGDLIGCLTSGRERFEAELARGRSYDLFAVVVEAAWQDVAQGNYRSKMTPHSACQSIMAFMARYGVPFMFAGSRQGAEYCTWSLLRQYQEGALKKLKRMAKEWGAA